MASEREWWTDEAPEILRLYGKEMREFLLPELMKDGLSRQEALLVLLSHQLFIVGDALSDVHEALTDDEGEEWKR